MVVSVNQTVPLRSFEPFGRQPEDVTSGAGKQGDAGLQLPLASPEVLVRAVVQAAGSKSPRSPRIPSARETAAPRRHLVQSALSFCRRRTP